MLTHSVRKRFIQAAMMSLLLYLPSAADDPELATRLDREFARLAAEDASQRDAAVEAIAKEGKAAEPFILRRLQTEKDPEARARLGQARQRIAVLELGARKWQALFTSAPIEDAPWEVALSLDGKLAATAGGDGRVILSDATTGKLLFELSGGTEPSWQGLGFSSDGRFLLALEGDDAPTVRVWRTADGGEEPSISGKEAGSALRLFHRQDGLTLIARRESELTDGRVVGWIVDTGGVLPESEPDPAFAVSRDGKQVVCAEASRGPGEERAIVVYSTATGERLFETTVKSEEVAIAPDASAMACVEDGGVRISALRKDAVPQKFGEGVRLLAWTGTDILTARTDGSLTLWKDGKAVRTVPDVARDADRLKTGNGVVCVLCRRGSTSPDIILSMESGQVLDSLQGAWLKWSSETSAFIMRSGERALVYRDGKRIDELVVPPGDRHAPLRASGNLLIFVRGGHTIVQDSKPDATQQVLPTHQGHVEVLAWTHEGIVASDLGGQSAIVDSSSGATLQRMQSIDYHIAGDRFVDLKSLGMSTMGWQRAVSANAAWVAVRDGTGIRIRDAAGLQSEKRIEIAGGPDTSGGKSAEPMALSQDGSVLAVIAGVDGFIDIFDTTAYRRLARIATKAGTPFNIAVAGDGPTILVASRQGDDAFITRYSPQGKLLGQNEWPSHGTIGPLPAHGRWVYELGDMDGGAMSFLAFDLKDPPALRTFTLPDFQGDSNTSIRLAPDGDRIVVESCGPEGMYVVSLEKGLIGHLVPALCDVTGATAFLEGGNLAVIRPDGLHTVFGASLEQASLDNAIHGRVLSASPDGKKLAIGDGCRFTVYELR